MLYGIRRDLQTHARRRRATASASTSRSAGEWFPYFMRRLGERPANVGFVLRGIVGKSR